MNKKIIYAVGGFVLLLILLRACSDHTPQGVAQQPVVMQESDPQPVAMQQPAQVVAAPAPVMVQPAAPVVVHDHDSGFMSGLLMGHLMGGGGHSSNVTHHTTVINKHYTSKRVTNVRPSRTYYGSRPTYRPRPMYSSRPAFRSRSSFRRR